MKKILLFLTVALLPLTAAAKVTVVTTLPVFASLVSEIGGDHVEVSSIARANQDPHFLDAKPSYVVALSRADLLVHSGLDLEIGWLPALLLQARNPKIQTGGPGDINTSQGLNIIEIASSADRSQGDVHPRGNPHTWLLPENGKLIAANIYKHLAQIDPDAESYYKSRFELFLKTLNGMLATNEASLKKIKGLKIITYHKSLSYFSNFAGLDVVATVEPKPGIPPNSKHIDALIATIKSQGVKAILIEEFYPRKIPEYLAEKGSIPLVIFTNTTGSKDVQTYTGLIKHLITELEKGTS